MPVRHKRTISKRTVDALSVQGKDAVVWDRDLLGFGVRVYPSGRKVYVVQSRGPNGSKRVTVGRHGTITADQARKRAAAIIDRIKTGLEPLPVLSEQEAEPTVADLADRYMRAHVAVNCKPSTAVRYRGVLDNGILPGPRSHADRLGRA